MKNWILALLAALCAAVGVATLRAATQSVMTGPRTPPGLGTAAPAPAAPSPASAIHDATVAPDKRQSADNNVSFPIDI